MQPATATVAETGQLCLAEELMCALGIPNGGDIDIILRDGCVELRKKHANPHEPAGLLDVLANHPAAATEDPATRARRQDEDFARRTSGC